MPEKFTYKIIVSEAKVYVPGASKLVASEFPAFKKDATVTGFGENVRVDTGKNIYAIKVADGQYLRPQDIAQVDLNGDVIATFTNKGGERLNSTSSLKVENFNSPLSMYSSDGTKTYVSSQPKPIFKIENDKLVRTGETYKEKNITATPKTVTVGNKKRFLLEIAPDKYLIHINVKPVPEMLAFINAAGDVAETPPAAKPYIEKGDSLVLVQNNKPGWALLYPILGATMAGGFAYHKGKPWTGVVAWAIAGATVGFGAVVILKPTPKAI